MESVFKDICKQINKIIRILTKVSESHPKVSKEIDLALYASIKVQKIVNKYLESDPNQQSFKPKVNEYQITRNSDSEDTIFTTAMQAIQNFKNSTFKLQRKINVLISEQDYKVKKAVPSQSVHPKASQSFRPKTMGESKHQKKRKVEKEVESEFSQQSRDLRSLDESIIKIVNNIKMAKQEFYEEEQAEQ